METHLGLRTVEQVMETLNRAIDRLRVTPTLEQVLEAVWTQVCTGGGKVRFGQGKYFDEARDRKRSKNPTRKRRYP